MDGFQMGNHTLELTPTKGAVVLGQLDGPAVLAALCRACFPWDSTRLLSEHHLKFGVLNQFTQEPEEHQQQREEGCGVPC